MHTLRHARFLARLVLAWFALSLGVAIASPLVKPVNFEVVCASSGTGAMKLVVKSDAGGSPHRTMFDCPLCTGAAPPPSQAGGLAPSRSPNSHVPQPFTDAPAAARILAPLPARGPPASPVI